MAGIANQIQKTIASLDEINLNSKDVSAKDWENILSNYVTAFESDITEYYNIHKDKNLPNPNPISKIEYFVPKYIKNLGESNKSNTYLNQIYLEYNSKFNNSTKLISETEIYLNLLGENINDIKNILNEIKSKIDKITTSLEPFSTDIIDNIIKAV